MKTIIATIAILAAAVGFGDIERQANQSWVLHKIDEVVGTNTASTIVNATNATLNAAKAYTDEHGGGGSGGLDTNTVADIANHAIATNATVSGLTSQVSSLESSKFDKTGGVVDGLAVFNEEVDFYGTAVIANGFNRIRDGYNEISLQQALDEKRDVDDNNFSGTFWLGEGNLNIYSPFGVYAHFANIRGYDTLDEGWSNIIVSAFGSSETMPEYLDRNISTNNPAFVSAVRATPPDPETPWGTYGTLGAAIAGIIAMLANKLTKGLDAQGVPTDPNVAELFSKSDTSQYPSAVVGALKNAVLEKSIVLAVTSNFEDADNTSYGSAE